MNRITFPLLLAGIVCILIVVALTASVAARQPVQALQPSSTATIPSAAHAPVNTASVGGSQAAAPSFLPGPSSSFDQALSSGRLARFSY